MSASGHPEHSDRSDKSDRSDRSDRSDSSHRPQNTAHQPRVIPPHGGYRRLRSFQCAQVVYDATVVFCNRFVDKRSRTHDQMVQAARSGVQNIAEGSMASATSKKAELKLTAVARASLEDLLLDYQDFLRQRRLRLWPKDSPQALAVRREYRSARPAPRAPSAPSARSDPSDSSDPSDRSDQSEPPSPPDPYGIATASAEVAANTLICLTHQASYLVGRQLRSLEGAFLDEGGFTERLYRARSDARARDRRGTRDE